MVIDLQAISENFMDAASTPLARAGYALLYMLKMKAISLSTFSALYIAGSIVAPAFARPYSYISVFAYSSDSATECLRGARNHL